VLLQRFNRLPTTIEALGALHTYEHLRGVLNLLTQDFADKYLISNGHETAGVLPAGKVYLFVRDRSIDTVAELAGKRIATMDYDKAAPVMVDKVGAIMVAADLGSIGPKFNNGDVEACYMPATAYGPFELHRGLGTKGGIVNLPLAQGTLQLLIHADKFPEGFGKKSRKFFYSKFDKALANVKQADEDLPDKYWVEIGNRETFDEMFLDVRLELRDKHGAYDGKMLRAMARNVRCKMDAARPECAEQKE